MQGIVVRVKDFPIFAKFLYEHLADKPPDVLFFFTFFFAPTASALRGDRRADQRGWEGGQNKLADAAKTAIFFAATGHCPQLK